MKKRLNGILTLLLVFVVQLTFAQQQEVIGTVTDEQGLPLPGVNVIVSGTNVGTQTDFDGQYAINVSQGQTLVFTYVGYAAVNRVVGQARQIDVVLAEDAAALEEVLVVGYGATTKQSFTGTAKKVEGELLERKSVSNVSQALSGEVAGLRVINTTGQPGTSAAVRIRGLGSVNGSRDPLYVVDGVPFTGSLNSINPADIASTTVLKDAAATAIYGARGANGVIVITTKSGRSGEHRIEVETRYGKNFQGLPRYDMIDSPEQYIGLSWEALYNRGVLTNEENPTAYANSNLFGNRGIDPRYNMWNVANGAELIDPATRTVRPGVTRAYTPENWEDFAFQDSNRQETNLRMSGGDDRTNYLTSFGYLNDVGYSINSDYERYTARLNVNHKVKDWLSGSMNIGYAVSETNNGGQSSDSGSVFWFVDNIPPIYPLFLRDENFNTITDPVFGGPTYDYGENGRTFGALTNSIADATVNLRRNMRHELNFNTSLTASITDYLSFETRFGSQYYNQGRDVQNQPFIGPSVSSGGFISKTKTELFSYNFLQMLRFNQSFGAHSLEVLAAHEANSWQQQIMFASKFQLLDPFGTELNNAIGVNPPGSYTNDFTLESYFSQANYNFDNKYFLSGTIRRDGSSRFVQNKWDTFGSVGAAWVLSQENFMQNQNLFSFFKLKASYGLIGDQGGVGFYPGFDLYSVNNLADNLSLSFQTKGNPELTWETSKMFQTGVEFSLGSWFDASVDYYIKDTDDLIFDRRIGPSRGYALLTVNDGALRNQGLEFDLAFHLVKQKDYFVDLTINGALESNELLRMPLDPGTGEEKILDQAGLYGRAVGRSLYDFYLREWAGVDPANGDGLWNQYSFNGEVIRNLTEYLNEFPDRAGDIDVATTNVYQEATERFVDKSAIPDARGAFNLSAGYKGFSVSAQFLYSIGGYAYDGGYADGMHNRVVGGNNWHTDIMDRWQQPGDVTNVPRIDANTGNVNVNSASTRFLVKSDYLALNNIRLAYAVPRVFVNQIGLNSLTFTLTGDNLFLLSERDGFNPMASESMASGRYQYAPLSTITGGVRLNF